MALGIGVYPLPFSPLFLPTVKSLLHCVPVPPQPCRRLVFLCKSPALALLAISAGDGLTAGRLDLVSYLVMLHDAVVIDCFTAGVDKLHGLPSCIIHLLQRCGTPKIVLAV